MASSWLMSPLDVTSAIPLDSAEAFDRLLAELQDDRREVIVAIARKASGRQTVTFHELLETAMCHGWVDTQTRRIDDERYAIRYVRRRPGSNWSDRNRVIARRLRADGRLAETGLASLPPDL
jgi:uncharacterized protein YdeI (YjbR/CyaY-like superfamily)